MPKTKRKLTEAEIKWLFDLMNQQPNVSLNRVAKVLRVNKPSVLKAMKLWESKRGREPNPYVAGPKIEAEPAIKAYTTNQEGGIVPMQNE